MAKKSNKTAGHTEALTNREQSFDLPSFLAIIECIKNLSDRIHRMAENYPNGDQRKFDLMKFKDAVNCLNSGLANVVGRNFVASAGQVITVESEME